jgi:hypothetical protein
MFNQVLSTPWRHIRFNPLIEEARNIPGKGRTVIGLLDLTSAMFYFYG